MIDLVSAKDFRSLTKEEYRADPGQIFEQIRTFFETQGLIDINIQEAKLEMILINQTTRSLAHLEFSFVLSPTGRVSPRIHIESFQNDIFSFGLFWYFGVYFCLGFIVWKTTLSNFINQIKKYFEDRNPPAPESAGEEKAEASREKDSGRDQSLMHQLFYRLLNYDIDKITSFREFFVLLWNRTWTLLQNWIEAIRIGVVYNTLYLGHLFSFILSLILLVLIFLLFFNSLRRRVASLDYGQYGTAH